MAHAKTEQPTRKRRQDARRRGQVAHSREVDTALALLAAFAAFRFGGGALWAGLEGLLRDSFAILDRHPLADPLSGPLVALLGPGMVLRALLLVLPLMLLIAGVSLLGGFLQSGGVFSTQAIRPQLKRLNPLQGAKRIFASKQALVALAKALLKFAIVGGIAAFTLRAWAQELAAIGVTMPLRQSLGVLADIGFELVVRVMLALLALAAADFMFQRYDLLGQLRMTRQEVRDELRQTEGDPLMRGRMAQVRRSFLTRVMEAVPKADVVLTNPTAYAVAIKYDPTADGAPKVIAKGERLVARRIREIALEHGIPVIEDPPLTRALHRAVGIGQEIAPDLYEAVAELLAFVYRLRYPQTRAVA